MIRWVEFKAGGNMSEIRYWFDATNSMSANNVLSQEAKNNSAKVQEVKNSFNSTLFEMLGDNNSTSLFDGIDGNLLNLFPNDSGLNQQLSDIKNQGMGKVLAAKLGSQLPFENLNSNKDKNEYQDGLHSMIDITMQLQIAKAKKSLNKTYNEKITSVTEYISNIEKNANEEKEVQIGSEEQNEKYLSESNFITSIQNEIDKAISIFNIDRSSLIDKIT